MFRAWLNRNLCCGAELWSSTVDLPDNWADPALNIIAKHAEPIVTDVVAFNTKGQR